MAAAAETATGGSDLPVSHIQWHRDPMYDPMIKKLKKTLTYSWYKQSEWEGFKFKALTKKYISQKVRNKTYMNAYYFAEEFVNDSDETRTINLKWDTNNYVVITHELDFEGKMQVTLEPGESVFWAALYKKMTTRFSWGLYQLWW